MEQAKGHAAFDELIEASKADGVVREITLRATPVIDALREGATIPVKQDPNLPEGTVPSQPDSLAIEIHISGAPGTMVGAKVLEIAANHGLKIANSDTLLT